MFSFFSKKPKIQRLDDKVYMTRTAADSGLRNDIKTMSAEGKIIFVIYFFDDTLSRLESQGGNLPVHFIKAGNILRDLSTRNSLKAKISPTLLFAEHHPSAKIQDDIMLELEAIFPENKPTVGFYMGMDEPMMQSFGSEQIISLMKRLGIKEDEAISHSMVTKSIHNAQEKIAKAVTSELSCNSQKEWMQKNYGK